MRTWPILIAVAMAGIRFAQAAEPVKPAQPESSCIWCHAQLDGAAAEPAKRIQEDVHSLRGLSCNDCHGGNRAAGLDGDVGAAHDERRGFTGKPTRTETPAFCARCHADAAFMKRFNPQARVDQLAEYRTSVHGKRNAAGDEHVAVCTDCHGVHGIRAVKDPRSLVYPTRLADTCGRCHNDERLLKLYGIPTGQYAAYRSSVHARALYEKGDLAAPTCKSCHGSHGAAPPGVESVANVCGSCHVREGSLFRETENKRHIDLTACIRCVVCHENHAVRASTDDMLGIGPRSTCTRCHDPASKAYGAIAAMSSALEGLKSRLAGATDILREAERAGMAVGPEQVQLRSAHDQLVELRVLAHAFDEEKFLAAARVGVRSADEGLAAGQRAFAELRRRRLGLGVSLVVILATIVGLALKVREIDGGQSQ